VPRLREQYDADEGEQRPDEGLALLAHDPGDRERAEELDRDRGT
jgi:hypothetical protein